MIKNLYEKALEIAFKAHAGQFDKGGKPYIEHPLKVLIGELRDYLLNSNQ